MAKPSADAVRKVVSRALYTSWGKCSVSADDRIASLATDISEGRPVDWAAAH